jgi:hypothetical protein
MADIEGTAEGRVVTKRTDLTFDYGNQPGALPTTNRGAGLVLVGILPAMAIAIGLIAVSGLGDSYSRAVSAGPPDNLIAIAMLDGTWLRVMALFVLMIVFMAVGLGLLSLSLYQAGSRALAPSALVLFALAATIFVGWATFEGTVTVWAAEETASTSIVPAGYEPLLRWADVLFRLFMLLAYLAICAFGGAILATRAVPAWAGWASLVLGGLGTIARLSDMAELGVPAWLPPSVPAWMLAGVPGWIPLWGAIIGVAVLTHRAPSK